jgi:four helix bundle protein
MQRHRSLIAWQRCRDLAVIVYRLTERFPPAERFGLTSQMRRAAVSSAANIAEGHARAGPAELQRFLSIALGSLAELDTLAEVATAAGILQGEALDDLQRARELASRATFALYRAVAGGLLRHARTPARRHVP